MNKKDIILGLLSIISVCLVIFIAGDLWTSADGFRERRFTKKEDVKIKVATSFYPLYFFAQQIGGDKIDLLNIAPIGSNPHNYKLTAQDITTIENYNLIILNGLGLESWAGDIQNIAKEKNIAVTIASANLNENQVIESKEDVLDPHIWLSPALAEEMVNNILAGFLQADSKNSDYYKANAAKLRSQLKNLDAKYRSGLASCENTDIVTSHPAFLYLARDYGLSQISISGLSPDTKLSEQQLKNITDFFKEQNIKYIFFDRAPNSELADDISTSVGAKTLVLNPIEILSSQEAKSNKNYFTEMEDNLVSLRLALQCK